MDDANHHYCHNCGHHAPLTGAFCNFCLTFWYRHGRWPRPGD